jgi:4-amino-4-deoxy-L-arabinose transferase-like glycosyltransferase
MNNLTAKPLFWLTLLLPFLCIPIFGHLGEAPLDSWDEARLAVNAHDMLRTGNWLVTTFEYSPDMWNTKPPFMIWMQVLSIRIFGENEFAIRFPSAIAALATCLIMFWFFTKKYGKPILGALACLVLISSEGYVRRHGIRTGDYDSLLTFFTTTFLLFWFLYVDEAKTKYIYVFACAITFASLTKGVQPLIFLPAILAYTIYRRKLPAVLRSPHTYIGLALFAFFVLGYYLLREHYNPGYIKAVYENELGGRFSTVLEEHHGNIWYYTGDLERNGFYFWYVLAALGVITGLGSENDRFIRQLTLWLGTAALTYLLIISKAATKLNWYDIPAIPLLAMLAAISLYSISRKLQFASDSQRILALGIGLVTYFLIPYRYIFKTGAGLATHTESDEFRPAQFFKQALMSSENLQGVYIAHEPALDQNHIWYIELLIEKKGIKTRGPAQIDVGKTVITFQPASEKFLEKHYEFDFLGNFHNVKKYYIKGRKSIAQIQ